MNRFDAVVSGEIDLSRVRGLLFDVDGTLSDSDDHLVDRLVHYLKPVSWAFKNKDSRPFARGLVMAIETPGNFIYGLTDKLGIDAHIYDFINWIFKKRRAKKPKDERFYIIPEVEQMLTQFSDRYPMAVVSARDAETTAHFLEHFDLMRHFTVVVTGQTCKYTKPNPDPVIFAAEQLGLNPEDCVMIGDTIVDIHAGKSAGAQTVGVLCGFGVLSDLKRVGADMILSTTPDLMKILTD